MTTRTVVEVGGCILIGWLVFELTCIIIPWVLDTITRLIY